MNLTSVPTMHPQVAERTVDGTAVIVLADLGEVKILNPVGTRVWESVDGKRTVQQIVDMIVAEFEVAASQAQEDVVDFLQQLVDVQAIRLL